MAEPMRDFYPIYRDMRLRRVASVEELRSALSPVNFTVNKPDKRGLRLVLIGPADQLGQIVKLMLSTN